MKRPDERPNGPARREPASADRRLKQALLAASPPPSRRADVDALTARVMAQWRERHADAPRGSSVADGGPAAPSRGAVSTFATTRRRLLWAGTAGLGATVAVATLLVVNRPDPALEELMQPDVLSQLAIGEM